MLAFDHGRTPLRRTGAGCGCWAARLSCASPPLLGPPPRPPPPHRRTNKFWPARPPPTNQQEAVATYNVRCNRTSTPPASPSTAAALRTRAAPIVLVAVHQRGRRDRVPVRRPERCPLLELTSGPHTGLGHYADPSGRSHPRAPPSRPPTSPRRPAPPLGPGGATYYDDNAWTGLNLIHAYLLTSNHTIPDPGPERAQLHHLGVGYETPPTAALEASCGRTLQAASATPPANGAGAALALELNRLTGNTSDLAWATSMYQWVVTCLGTASGLYTTMSIQTAVSTRRSGVTTRA